MCRQEPEGEELSASESREEEDGDNEPFLRTLPLSPLPSRFDRFPNTTIGGGATFLQYSPRESVEFALCAAKLR